MRTIEFKIWRDEVESWNEIETSGTADLFDHDFEGIQEMAKTISSKAARPVRWNLKSDPKINGIICSKGDYHLSSMKLTQIAEEFDEGGYQLNRSKTIPETAKTIMRKALREAWLEVNSTIDKRSKANTL